MGDVTSDVLAGLTTGVRVIFLEGLGAAGLKFNIINEIATRFNSDTDQESYGWLGANPTMNEWKDQRQYAAIKAYSQTLKNVSYEGTLEVDREAIEDDKFSLYPPRIRTLANEAMRHINETVVSKLDAGATDLAYDAVAFFADTRTIGDSANIDNLLSGSYSNSGDEIRAAVRLADSTMMLYQNDKGKPMGLQIDTIVCPAAMYIPIIDALFTPGIAGSPRPEAGLVSRDRVFKSPWIDDDVENWYILTTQTVEVKPLILQMRKDPEFVAMDDPKSSHVFKNRSFLYGVDDRFVVGYGDPRTAIKIVDA